MLFRRKGPRNILVIKLEGVSDFVAAEPAFAAVRAHHPEDTVYLLTADPLARLAKAAPHFDHVLSDGAPKDADARRALVAKLRRLKCALVYDLDSSERTQKLFQMLGPFPPKWSAGFRGCAFPYAPKKRETVHAVERYAAQLDVAGLAYEPRAADLTWALGARKDAANMKPSWYGVSGPFALLAPALRESDRWPTAFWADLAERMSEAGVIPIVVGGKDRQPLAATIARHAPKSINLAGKTDLLQMAALADGAEFFVSDRTANASLAAALGCPGVMLLGPQSVARRDIPFARNVVAITSSELSNVPVSDVLRTLRNAGHMRAVHSAAV